MKLSAQLADRLSDLQLDPIYVADIVERTIDEDLAGGEDVTSIATIPADQVSVAEFRARKTGTGADDGFQRRKISGGIGRKHPGTDVPRF